MVRRTTSPMELPRNKRINPTEMSFPPRVLEQDDCSTCVSTNATESNRAGAGRALGNLYDWTGGKLERLINVAADRLGFGPFALERRILLDLNLRDWKEVEMMWDKSWEVSWSVAETNRGLSARKKKGVKKYLKALVKYTHSDMSSTQLKSLQLITNLAIFNPDFADIFGKFQVDIALATLHGSLLRRARHGDPDVDPLLSASRVALYSVEDNEVHRAGKELARIFIDTPYLWRFEHTNAVTRINELVFELCQFTAVPHFAFLALRYLGQCDLNNLPDPIPVVQSTKWYMLDTYEGLLKDPRQFSGIETKVIERAIDHLLNGCFTLPLSCFMHETQARRAKIYTLAKARGVDMGKLYKIDYQKSSESPGNFENLFSISSKEDSSSSTFRGRRKKLSAIRKLAARGAIASVADLNRDMSSRHNTRVKRRPAKEGRIDEGTHVPLKSNVAATDAQEGTAAGAGYELDSEYYATIDQGLHNSAKSFSRLLERESTIDACEPRP